MIAWIVAAALSVVASLGLTASASGAGEPGVEERSIHMLLDAWHNAAARADEDAYFDAIAEDGVFLGTDATERWVKPEFRTYAHPYFEKGKAWTFHPRDRKLLMLPAPAGQTSAAAWFDELLDTEKMGVCRGSGVLVRTAKGWQVAQYNLSIPIPNDLSKNVIERIAEFQKSGAKPEEPATAGDQGEPAAGEPAASGVAIDLSVMSFNIRYSNAGDGPDRWERRVDQVVALLRRENADVIGLQEALSSQLENLRIMLPGYEIVGVGRDDGATKGEYCAILYNPTRLELVQSGTFWLSDSPDVPGSTSWGNRITRICTWARLRDRESGRAFYVYNAHLDHESAESRVKSAELIRLRIAGRDHDEPVVVTGDLNAGEQSAEVQALRTPVAEQAALGSRRAPVLVDSYRVVNAGETNVGTFHGFRGGATGEKIDYILVPEGTGVESAGILRENRWGRYPSDHYPVIARVRLEAKEVGAK